MDLDFYAAFEFVDTDELFGNSPPKAPDKKKTLRKPEKKKRIWRRRDNEPEFDWDRDWFNDSDWHREQERDRERMEKQFGISRPPPEPGIPMLPPPPPPPPRVPVTGWPMNASKHSSRALAQYLTEEAIRSVYRAKVEARYPVVVNYLSRGVSRSIAMHLGGPPVPPGPGPHQRLGVARAFRGYADGNARQMATMTLQERSDFWGRSLGCEPVPAFKDKTQPPTQALTLLRTIPTITPAKPHSETLYGLLDIPVTAYIWEIREAYYRKIRMLDAEEQFGFVMSATERITGKPDPTENRRPVSPRQRIAREAMCVLVDGPYGRLIGSKALPHIELYGPLTTNNMSLTKPINTSEHASKTTEDINTKINTKTKTKTKNPRPFGPTFKSLTTHPYTTQLGHQNPTLRTRLDRAISILTHPLLKTRYDNHHFTVFEAHEAERIALLTRPTAHKRATARFEEWKGALDDDDERACQAWFGRVRDFDLIRLEREGVLEDAALEGEVCAGGVGISLDGLRGWRNAIEGLGEDLGIGAGIKRARRRYNKTILDWQVGWVG